jgi:hypothetical protein
MTWFAVRRPYDIANSIPTSLYVASIIVEDFALSISTTVQLSSVPLQMLIYLYKSVAGACSIQPNITDDRPNRVLYCLVCCYCLNLYIYSVFW